MGTSTATTAGARRFPLEVWTGVLIALSPLLLLINCWNAEFLPYDDVDHIFATLGPLNLQRLFLAPEHSTYFPIAILSYRLDSLLFPWMPKLLGTWAPGVRLMTCVYHAGAALFVWRIVRLLGLSPGKALFVALAFAVHPTACETVCWASERKNALAALFGFASLWAFLRYDGQKRRMPLTVLFYLLAVWSKPSALGLAPVLLLADLCGGARGLARSKTQTAQCENQRRPICIFHFEFFISVCWRFLPVILISGGAVIMNLIGHARTLVPPPGGTVFTALLTDAEVLSRYLYNIFVPVGLSIAYFVAPIASPLEPRFLGYAALLALLFAVTVWLTPNRRLTLFGWLWFVLALGPNLNLISIPQVMQDRYLYLGLPGILLVSAEFVCALVQRAHMSPRLALGAAIPFVIGLAALGIARGGLFGNLYLLFDDGVRKQPLSAHAHHGLSIACAQICETAGKQKRWAERDEARHRCGQELQFIIDHCPDATRQVDYLNTAYEAGKYALVLHKPADAERYFRLILDPPAYLPAPQYRIVQALVRLAELKLALGLPEEAYRLAGQAVAVRAADGEALLARASAALALAATTPDEQRRQELRRQAAKDADAVPKTCAQYAAAQQMRKALKE
ncbi:MAG: hypothetical protein NTW87_18330 [Planctomycetota bacterium]|nr:hypothetical protein [Planctomycetota bacterium]